MLTTVSIRPPLRFSTFGLNVDLYTSSQLGQITMASLPPILPTVPLKLTQANLARPYPPCAPAWPVLGKSVEQSLLGVTRAAERAIITLLSRTPILSRVFTTQLDT